MPYRFFSRKSVIDNPIPLFGRQAIEDALYRQHLVCLLEFGILDSPDRHNVMRRKESAIIQNHVLVRFGKILFGNPIGQFVPYAHARIVSARVGKANIRIFPDCNNEYPNTVLRQITRLPCRRKAAGSMRRAESKGSILYPKDTCCKTAVWRLSCAK